MNLYVATKGQPDITTGELVCVLGEIRRYWFLWHRIHNQQEGTGMFTNKQGQGISYVIDILQTEIHSKG